MSNKIKATSVRLTPPEFSRLEELSEIYSVPMTTVIRWSINALHQYVESNDGSVKIPIDFNESTPGLSPKVLKQIIKALKEDQEHETTPPPAN